MCLLEAKALARLCICTGLSEPSLLTYDISTKISCLGSYESPNSCCYVFRTFFAITFYISILAKCVPDEKCRGDLVPSAPKGPKLVYIDEVFAIN